MTNELLLIGSVIFIFSAALLGYKFFGKTGLYCLSVIATVLANIEVLILITDILSECEGKKEANKAVWLGMFTSLFFLLLSQSWLLYTPNENDTIFPSIQAVFSSTPRMLIASFAVYAVSQMFDVWLYHKWWAFTEKKFGDRRKFLWLRNNGSTLVSQLINTFLFTLLAFYGTYDFGTLVSVFCSSYVIYIFTSLLDTPVVYLARRIHEKEAEKKAK